MEYFWHGLGLGLALSVLIGPLFIALTQTGMEKGFRAGLALGTGIWASDLFVILMGYIFIREIQDLINDPVFFRWMGFTGGIILMITGIATVLKKPAETQSASALKAKTLLGYWTKGFSINFFNPFTFVFWLGVLSTYVAGRMLNVWQSAVLLGTIMLVIMLTDTFKVYFGKLIRTRLSQKSMYTIGKFAGVILCIFGIVLIWRSKL